MSSENEIEAAVLELIKSFYGDKIGARSVTPNLVSSAIKRRMRDLGINQFIHYLMRVRDNHDELEQLVSMLTIHTTSWFRESVHFLRIGQEIEGNQTALPAKLRFLSAACSTGEEVYSLGLLLEYLRTRGELQDYEIVGFDIDPISIQSCQRAEYQLQHLQGIPNHLHRHLSRFAQYFTPVDEIKSRCQFHTADLNRPLTLRGTFHWILCRNVLIYYSPSEITKVCRSLLEHLSPEGKLVLGHCDMVDADALGLKQFSNAIYTKTQQLPSEVDCDSGFNILLVDDERELAEIVADTLTLRHFCVHKAYDGREAVEILNSRKIDLLVSDYKMPGMNGLQLARHCREHFPQLPILMISAFPSRDVMEQGPRNGIHEFLSKPVDYDYLAHLCFLYQKGRRTALALKNGEGNEIFEPELIIIGASTGGPEALHALLADMPQSTPPIVVVQHMESDFAGGFAKRLTALSGLCSKTASHHPFLETGHLYYTDTSRHIEVVRSKSGRLSLRTHNQDKVNGHRPSVDVLFNSVSRLAGVRTVAILLTGMGRDGANGMFNIKMHSNAYTMCQDESSSVVYGMPKEAVQMGACDFQGSPKELRTKLESLIFCQPYQATASA